MNLIVSCLACLILKDLEFSKNMHQATESELQIGLTTFIENCVLQERTQRYLTLLSSLKGRKKWLQKLDHFQPNLKTDNAIVLNPAFTSTRVIELLGIPGSTHALCFSTLRGAELGLMGNVAALVEYAWGFGCGSIICTLNSQQSVQLYLGEEKQAQYMFKKA